MIFSALCLLYVSVEVLNSCLSILLTCIDATRLLYCIVLYYIALYCIVLYCIVLFYSNLFNCIEFSVFESEEFFSVAAL